MKTKIVNRYYCDFCRKSGGSASAMSRHEKHCTLNPNRECRVCQYMTETYTGTPVSELLKILPKQLPSDVNWTHDEWYRFYDAVDEAMPKLREAAGNCPACILAALRQSGAGTSSGGFDFRKEMEAVWSDVNTTRAENGY